MKAMHGLVVLACAVLGSLCSSALAYEYPSGMTTTYITYIDNSKGGVLVTTNCKTSSYSNCPQLYTLSTKGVPVLRTDISNILSVTGQLNVTANEAKISSIAAARTTAVSGASSADSSGNALACPAEGCITTVAKQQRTTVPLVDVDVVVIPKISQSAPALPAR